MEIGDTNRPNYEGIQHNHNGIDQDTTAKGRLQYTVYIGTRLYDIGRNHATTTFGNKERKNPSPNHRRVIVVHVGNGSTNRMVEDKNGVLGRFVTCSLCIQVFVFL